MQVNNWFKNGCNYHEGILLYQKQKGHSVNLVRLFLKKESLKNLEKLKYELSKFKEPELKKEVDKPTPKTEKVNLQVDFLPKPTNQQPTTTSQYFYRLNQLDPKLHPLAIKQRNDFQTAISLKLKLNALHPSEEGEALKLCLQIEDLFDAIETSQKVLDHYVQHKVVLNVSARTYHDYTGGQLADARRNKRTSVTKFKKKVNTLEQKLNTKLPLTEKNKIEVQLQKAQESLLRHEMDLQELNDLINEKGWIITPTTFCSVSFWSCRACIRF